MTDTLSEVIFFFSRLDWLSAVDILLVTLVIFSLLQLVRGTQAVVLLRGIIFLVFLDVILIKVFVLRDATLVGGVMLGLLPALMVGRLRRR